jgi:uncharacterized membrane protein
MAWFHPKSLLDKTYEIGILIKGIDGFFELLAGLLLVAVPSHLITDVTHHLTKGELAQDPHDYIASHVVHYGNSLAGSAHIFAAMFLLTHGLTKLVIVVCLLRNKLWAYPFGLIVFSLFIAYQLYQIIVKPTSGMVFLTVLDGFIVWLIWREWQKQKAKPTPVES